MATDITRRAALGLVTAGLICRPGSLHGRSDRPLIFGAYADAAGFGVAGLDESGAIRYAFGLPGRGHGFACSRQGERAVAFARRPGAWAMVFAIQTGRVLQRVDATDGRSFCGHGVFSDDGTRLYATEVIAETGEGVVGVYNAAAGFVRIAEWPTNGLDPHELVMLPGRQTLAIANGGILIRADLPRLKLNLPEMDPSLVYMDAVSGQIIRQIRPPPELHQLGIRHLAATPSGQIIIATQYEGHAQDRVPLIALHEGVGSADCIRFAELPGAQLAALKQYCGSIAVHDDGRCAVTSPRGNTALVLDLPGRTATAMESRDICGVAGLWRERGFIFSSGTGSVSIWSVSSASRHIEGSAIRWDNHLARVG